MEVYQTENQQLEAIKQFLQKYKNVIMGVFLGFALVLAVTQYWRHHQSVQSSEASNLYQEMLDAEVKQDQKILAAKGKQLMDSFSTTPYPQLAALLLAKHAVIAGDTAQAEEKLKWVIEQRKSKHISLHIAKTRLARIMLEKGEFDAAVKLLDTKKLDKPYVSLYEETLGDIYLAQGNKDQAKVAYTNAVNNLPQGAEAPILRMKLMNLGGQPEIAQLAAGENNA